MRLLSKILFGAMIAIILACGGGGGTGVGVKESQIAFWGRVGTQNALYISQKGKYDAFTKVADIPDSTSFVRLSPDRTKILWIEKNFLFAIKVDGTGKVAFGAGMKTANADWGADSDVILIEPLGINKISSTRMSDPTNSTILFNDVTEMNVTFDGTMMTFVPLGTRAVHFSNTDGTGLDSLAAEPAGSAVMEPTFNLQKTKIAYTVSGSTLNQLKVVDLETRTVTVVSGTTDVLGSDATPFQFAIPVGIGFEAGTSSFIYSLKAFGATVKTLDSTATGSIHGPSADPSMQGSVVYTKGTGVYFVDVLSETPTPSLISDGLDAAGYADWR